MMICHAGGSFETAIKYEYAPKYILIYFSVQGRLGFSSIDIINSPNDPAFKRRRCSIFVEVTDLFYCLQTQVRTRPASDLKRLLYHRFRYFKVFWKFSWCNLNPLFVDECFQILNLRKLLSK